MPREQRGGEQRKGGGCGEGRGVAVGTDHGAGERRDEDDGAVLGDAVHAQCPARPEQETSSPAPASESS